MKSCDDCPGSEQCSGQNLYPVLVRVFDLYDQGVTDKFDILFALSDEDEAILERYTTGVSPSCWSKAALLAIVEVLTRLADGGLSGQDVPAVVGNRIATARTAFARFPWQIEELVEQAPELYALLQERCPDDALCGALSKRQFMKMCKDIAFA